MNVFHCHACGETNDARVADWCSCVTTEPTLLCSSCGHCFCNASQHYRRDFWRTASTEVRSRRREAQRLASVHLAGRKAEAHKPVILLIDDDRIVHFIVNRALAAYDLTIVHARDGREGLELAKELRPDLVITDALLPRLDGREIARALKSDPVTSACKVVVMTGLYRGLKYRNEALQTFLCDDYLEKPVSQKNLIDCVSRFIELEPAAAAAGKAEPAGAGSTVHV